MAVLRNPVLFVLFVLLVGGGWFAVQAGLVGPMMKIGNAVVDQSIEIARVLTALAPHLPFLALSPYVYSFRLFWHLPFLFGALAFFCFRVVWLLRPND